MVLDTAGYDIIDKTNFVGDGSTVEFLTSATYSIDNITAFVLINGQVRPFEITKSVKSDGIENNVKIIFPIAPPPSSLIQIMIFSGSIQKWSQINTQYIPIISGENTYILDPLPQYIEPLSAMAIVLEEDDFLQAPDFEYYTIEDMLYSLSDSSYQIKDLRYAINSLTLNDIKLYKNGVKLPVGAYSLIASTNTIVVKNGYAKNGDVITIEINKYSDFVIDGTDLILSRKNYSTAARSYLKVTTFTNHDILKIKTNSDGFKFIIGYDLQTYDTQGYDLTNDAINAGGIISLPRQISTSSGLFVSFSRKLLTPNVDYVLLDNRSQIKVLLPTNLTGGDYVQVTTFNPETVKPPFGYKIFKDMLNRYHYKRFDDNASTVLVRDLKITDTEIYVEDASKLPLPSNDPILISSIYIDGERIEYFTVKGNVLSNIRRATLGTGSRDIILKGAYISDTSIAQTIPYTDTEIKTVSIADGSTRNIELEYRLNARVGTIDDGSTRYDGWYRETEVSTITAGNFIIGHYYTIVSLGTTNFMLVGATVNRVGTGFIATGVGSGNGTVSYVNYTSIPPYYGQCDEIEVFVNGTRLRKNPIEIYDPMIGSSSPSGNKQIEAEFSVDDGDRFVRLTKVPDAGDTIVIIKKTGKLWQDITKPASLGASESNIASFLTVKQARLPK
jgi:hypothetical protein